MNTPSVSVAPVQTFCRGDGLRGHLGLESSTPLVVYVGSVTVDRGLALTVEAMALLPNVHFAVVGPRYEATEREMVEVARRVGVENRIHLVDAVAPDEVMGFVASADCSVIPIQNVCLSYYFCFPNKLLESVLAGLPVVVADLLELRRFIERFPVGVVVDASDPSSLAGGVERVLADPARYIPGKDTRQRIVESFGWSVQASRLLTMYRDIGDAVKPVAIGARVPTELQS
jgi:glycosyltransferase involved in cell wall biosynthesis